MRALWCCALLLLAHSMDAAPYSPSTPRIIVLQPKGLRFEIIDDTPGLTQVTYHYSVNVPLPGTRTGQYNVDVASKDGRFAHKNKELTIQPGDTIYYWLHALVNGAQYQLTDLKWTYAVATTPPPSPPVDGSATSSAELTTAAPDTTTAMPETTTAMPETTTAMPETTTAATATTSTPRPLATQGCATAIAGLQPWNPGHDAANHVVISGQRLLLSSSATVHSIEIINGGILVFADDGAADIKLRARHVLVRDAGELHIGSESCRHRSRATIELYGRSTDNVEVQPHGQKFIAVERGGTLEIHGEDRLSWTLLQTHIAAGTVNPVVTLADDASSWRAGDRLIVSSTDYSMDQAEEFTVSRVAGNQVYLTGTARYLHYGGFADGVDMRAEVGLLSRNVLVTSQTESACYGDNQCQYFPDLDTFGGHMIFYKGHHSVHLEGLEVTKMGQQLLGKYPVHFHMCDDVDTQGGYLKPAYVKQLSIHHCFHRCVTIHGTDGLLVQDTVGYDTLGHCYFLEDGAERRNVLDHNLGLLTRPSTVLPSDRDANMCRTILKDALPGYTPDPSECNGVSTFWITHPENTLINNAAGGSDKVGYWYVFHSEPSGPSKGKLPPGQSSRAPMTKFYNNRAHSNPKSALIIDNGVKTTPPDSNDRRLQFSIGPGQYTPHVNADLKQDRAPAIVEKFVAFKNVQGLRARGGDIYIRDSQFGDHEIGVSLGSGRELPQDPGSHQEIVNSLFVGESVNRGTRMPPQAKGGFRGCPVRGADGIDRVGPCSPSVVGFQIRDGPVKVEGCTFKKFAGPLTPRGLYRNAALAFVDGRSDQMTTTNTLLKNSYDNVTTRVWTGKNNLDGDKTAIFHDQDGSTSGILDGYVMRPENALTQHAGCLPKPDWNAVVCSGKNAMVWFSARGGRLLTLVRDEFPNSTLQLSGVRPSAFQPVMMLTKTYTAHWDTQAPTMVRMRIVNFNQGDWLRIGLCYPTNATTFEVFYEIEFNMRSRVGLQRRSSLAEVDSGKGDGWYWEPSTGLLFVKVQAREPRQGWNYCSTKGCETLNIRYSGGDGSPASDCRNAAYGPHQLTPASIPMIQA